MRAELQGCRRTISRCYTTMFHTQPVLSERNGVLWQYFSKLSGGAGNKQEKTYMANFQETGLGPKIMQALNELGFESPTPVQEKSIPFLLETRRDLLALAQTGTGKTAAFSLPILEQISTSEKHVQAIVLSPTRELALQIAKDIERFSKYIDGLETLAVYGGTSIEAQIKQLKKGAQIVVGTPGRVNDLIRRKKLKLENIGWLVLDEADEMLSMGFKEELDTILAETPETKQTLLFSATMPQELNRITKKYMSDPEIIEIGKRNTGAEKVDHVYYMVNAKNRYAALKRIADVNPDIYGIIFCRTRQETKDVAEKLMHDGYNADALHGDLTQDQRDRVMARFRVRHLQMLVATDVAARGLDVNNLTHVINYNLPDDIEVYTHRSGRTGRAGKSGTSIAIIHTRERGKIKTIEKMIKKEFQHAQVPKGKEICEKQLFNLVDRVEGIEVDHEQIDTFLPAIYEKLEHLSREDLIQHFVSVEFNRFLEYYKNAPDLNVDTKSRRDDREERSERGGREKRRGRGTEFSRYHINVGSRDKLTAHRLIGLVNEIMDSDAAEIGKIEIMRGFSFFEVESSFAEKFVAGYNNDTFEFEGREIAIETSTPKKESSGRRRSGGREGSKEGGRSFGGNRGGSGGKRRSSDKKFDKKFSSRRIKAKK